MLLVCTVFVSVFFMISNKITNVDSPIYASDLTRRLVYTDAELALGEKVVEHGSHRIDVRQRADLVRAALGLLG